MVVRRKVKAIVATMAAAVLIGTVSGAASALSTDREEPILIEARSAEADNKAQVTIYRGDVVITQGTLRITGDTVWIHYSDSNTITKAISVGTPAKFRQLPDGKDDYMTADAERMEYIADQDLIHLIGNARYGEGADKITAPRIDYDSRLGRAKAGPDAAGGGSDKVRITITPKKK